MNTYTYEYYTMGSFSLCLGWCQQTQYPWLDTFVHGDGSYGLNQGIN